MVLAFSVSPIWFRAHGSKLFTDAKRTKGPRGQRPKHVPKTLKVWERSLKKKRHHQNLWNMLKPSSKRVRTWRIPQNCYQVMGKLMTNHHIDHFLLPAVPCFSKSVRYQTSTVWPQSVAKALLIMRLVQDFQNLQEVCLFRPAPCPEYICNLEGNNWGFL